MGLLIPAKKMCTECNGYMVLDEYKMEYVCNQCGLVEEVMGVQVYSGERDEVL